MKRRYSSFEISALSHPPRPGASAFEESLRFEKIHEDTYRSFGFELHSIVPGNVIERVHSIRTAVEKPKKTGGAAADSG